MVVGKESKIEVTTRNYKVASIMGIDSPFVLKCLKETQSWDLFSKIAFREGQEKVHPNLVEILKEIVNKCNGVPLVIKTLGTILYLKTEESQWLSIKNTEKLLSLGIGNDNILSVLKLSYDNLPIHLKQCFTFCASFPKDYEIEKKLLVELWIAQGYILDEDVGDEYFEGLLSRLLLEEFEKDAYNNLLSCKMYDLIHDLAQSVIGSEVLTLNDDVKEISKEVLHVSLSGPNLKLTALKVKHIRTLLSIKRSNQYDSKENVIFNSTFSSSSFKGLRVLGLNHFYLNSIPKCLDQLTHLRYLDLSKNKFEILPNSITKLKNLQILQLAQCFKLKEFPKDIRESINLRHLENNGCCGVTHMPCGIGELTLLQTLRVFIVGNRGGGFRDDHEIGRLSELKGLNNLKGELRIENLQNVRDVVVESRKANLKEKKYVQSLRLEWWYRGAQSSEDSESPMEGLQPHPNLKGYGGMRFPSWMMNGGLSTMLPNLITINLEGCSRCHTLPCFV
ncbi:hypothetical protein VitviT2T_030584 [Vitis vinifera]|uniref:NB-ARC domain-containing protein n=1 Tax=Vitis vinifera TaxID=29760 RepID=A0ABY9E1C8_VITVI|nr:hypothetical protein VitviT2T_030584 [Vitis vinifera]